MRDRRAELLQSIVDVARAIFGAKAATIMLLDHERDELVFEAISGEGSDTLVGRRLPSGTGIAGWVLRSQEPLVLEDVTQDPRFARDAAEQTGYVPKGLMSAPMLSGDRALGVLQVLDRPLRVEFSLIEANLLALFARQAALAVEVVGGGPAGPRVLDDLADAIEALEGPRRRAALQLLDALSDLLRD